MLFRVSVILFKSLNNFKLTSMVIRECVMFMILLSDLKVISILSDHLFVFELQTIPPDSFHVY